MMMRCLVLALCLSGVWSDEEVAEEGGVKILTEANFDAWIEANPTALIEFYAPWCGHCKQLAPEYEKAAQALARKDLAVPLAKVDATVEAELGKRFDVSGYPTLKWFKDGEKSDYDGPRDADGIVEWVSQKADPNYKPPPSDVEVLTVENFDDKVKDQDIALVEFYAPWCGHCKKLAPEYEKAARRLKPHGIMLANVDATVEKDLGKEYGVSGYPTLKIFRKGKAFEYNGPREADGITSFMLEQSKPAAKELASADEVRRFLSKDDVTIIGFFASMDSKVAESFSEWAESAREDYKTVGYSLEPAVMKALKAEPGDIILYQPDHLQSKYEPKSVKINRPTITREDIVAWVADKVNPLVGHRTQANAGKRFTKFPLVVIYYTVDFKPAHREGTQYWRNKVLRVASEKAWSAYNFAISDEDEFANEMKSLGLDESGQDINVAVFGKDGKKYPWNPDEFDDFCEEVLREFMGMINTGRVKAYIKSAPLPKSDGPVKTLVASNFDKIVNDDSKDVLIEFYAPWCGHCKQLEPIYKELAIKHKGNKNLVIAKFDATANDVPDKYKVEGFPTLYWAPKGKKSDPEQYSGGRTLDALTDFIAANGVASKADKTEL